MTDDLAPAHETYAMKLALIAIILQFAAKHQDPQKFTRDFFDDCITSADVFGINAPVDPKPVREKMKERLRGMQQTVLDSLSNLRQG